MFIELATALALQVAPLRSYEQAVVDCVVARTVELGRGNTESSEAVIRVANARCREQWDHAELVWEGLRVVGQVREADQEERVLREEVNARAFEALIAARAANRP